MSENIHKARRGRFVSIAVASLVAVYFLSLAPVQWLQGEGYLGGDEWRDLVIYTPIAFFADHSPEFVEHIISWYAGLLYSAPHYAA